MRNNNFANHDTWQFIVCMKVIFKPLKANDADHKNQHTQRRTHPLTPAQLRHCQHQALWLQVSWEPAAWPAASERWR